MCQINPSKNTSDYKCSCPCHTRPGEVMHCIPCCGTCPYCGETNIVNEQYDEHLAVCPNKCHCVCHEKTEGGVPKAIHITVCCHTCPDCKMTRIKSMDMHQKYCPAKY